MPDRKEREMVTGANNEVDHMTDHILNAELCAKCPAKKICLAIVPDGEWNSYIGKNPCPAILQKPRDDAPAALYHANQREKMHP